MEPYASFRLVNNHIINKTRNFTTGLALLYLFDHLMRNFSDDDEGKTSRKKP
jgi:hypothetical protein